MTSSTAPTAPPLPAPEAFDLCGELPRGTTLLEASAGTGKTFTIAALATRYVAEGRGQLDRLLMITFGRAATRELRERVRGALTAARDALTDPAAARAHDNAVIAALATGHADEVAARQARLAHAVATFDSATIATTHQFCHQMLASLGMAADLDPDGEFVEDISGLVREVVDDFYLRKYRGGWQSDRLPYSEARELADIVVNRPQALLYGQAEPLGASGTAQAGAASTRLAFAGAVRQEVARRRRLAGMITFDDLVDRLAAALTSPDTGETAVRQLRDRFSVVLVDEFQDTDPQQWLILRTAFHGHCTLILIGDPKQAIYGFRGGDVFSYLDAAEHADHHATLTRNWRSDAPVVNGLAELFGGIELGDPRILVRPVEPARKGSRLSGLPERERRVRLRWLPPAAGEQPAVASVRQQVMADVVADIAALLGGRAKLTPAHGPARPLAPADIAVLVPLNSRAEELQSALLGAGIPAVINGTTSVFCTPAAGTWRQLLAALDEPRVANIQAVALSDFHGYSADQLIAGGDALTSEVGVTLREWAGVLANGSVAQLAAAIEAGTGLSARVLKRPEGERALTDVRHVGALLHAHQRATRSGAGALRDWLDEQIRQAAEGGREQVTERTRRLDTDAAAVQILTIHRSKGLEFPVVYVPYGWDRHVGKPKVLACHENGQRVLDVRGSGAPERQRLLAAHRAEEAGEDLRLLYVAATRAASLVVVHWASSRNTPCAPLHRLLGARQVGVSAPASSYDPSPPLAGLAGQWVACEKVGESQMFAWAPPGPDLNAPLAVAPYDRRVDTSWRRTSYSGLTAGVHDLPETAPSEVRDDEPGHLAELESPPGSRKGLVPSPTSLVSPFAEMPAGAAFGTLVHEVLEQVDTTAPDLAADVDRLCAERLIFRPIADLAPPALSAALLAVLRTPLGPLAGGLSLAEIPPTDRLAELSFELPLGTTAAPATAGQIAELVRRHLPADDPLVDYPAALAGAIGEAQLHGFLTGSIDAVLRIRTSAGQPRFLVVDYKTNWLGGYPPPGGVLTTDAYHPELLPAAMIAAHYPLQALLYSAALHRYLRWRLPGYDPDAHLGGVLYLFVRGMAGPDTPTTGGRPTGVFSWAPPPALVVELAELLDGVRP